MALSTGNLPRLDQISIDGRVLLFTVAISILAGVLFGLIPVWTYARPPLAGGLREGGRTLSQGRERHRARNGLVVAQVALALVLLISSGLMIRTFQGMNRGFPEADGDANVPAPWPAADTDRHDFRARCRNRLDAADGVALV